MSEVAKKWYVVRAISGKEKRVKEYLEIEMGRMKSLDENIEQVLIPTEKIFQIRNGKKVNKERAYLPGYVFN
jgi:transcriptional antiterminator NusG